MSQALDQADLIRARLLAAPAPGELPTPLVLAEVAPVIVDRQKNLLPEVTKAVEKTKGCAIIILWTGFTVADKNSRTPRLSHGYRLTVISQPVLAGANRPADDIIESILLRLWHWRPGGGHAFGEVQIGTGALVPNESYLIYEIELTIPASL